MKLPRLLFLVFFLLFAPAISAGESIRPFVAGSLAKILAEHQGKPFVLAFWSVTCAYCPTELKALGKIRKSHPKLDVVLVAADTQEDAPLAAEMVASFGLGKVEQWIFADDMPERLRFEIDQRWHGELPRTHFYDRDHRVKVVSGVVPPQRLADWVKANVQ
jgi:thiol-disulfide isomerase/thioredoxin